MNRDLKSIVEATSTPLASIFGSGFLIIVPILAGAVAAYSVPAIGNMQDLTPAINGPLGNCTGRCQCLGSDLDGKHS